MSKHSPHIHHDYILNFLVRMEGQYCQAYIPCTRIADGKCKNYIGPAGTPAADVPFAVSGQPHLFRAMGASGVTIGIGCDLGQTTAKTLDAYGTPDQIIADLMPYFGKRKAAALAALHAQPFSLNQQDAATLSLAVINGYIGANVIPAFDAQAVCPFAKLPPQAQAVITSCCYQKGCAGVRRDWPMLWSHLTACNWQRASHELRYGFSQYKSRRAAEAELLSQLA